jgi:hypothetical protein
MPIIACTGQSEARGRNRWCRLAEAELTLFTHGRAEEARLCLDLFSHRRGRSAPVILVLTVADATALAQALQEAVRQLAAVLRFASPCCPPRHAPSPWPRLHPGATGRACWRPIPTIAQSCTRLEW